MELNLKKPTLLRIIIAVCFLPFMQQVAAQDSSGSESAKMTLTLVDQDSVKQVMAKITNADTAVSGVEVHFFVKKSFGLLPLEGDFTTTDDSGEASVDFPKDLPGDLSGNVVIMAKVEENETVGTLESMKTINWGVPIKAEPEKVARSLSSSRENAPWPLAITVTSVVVIVWGIIFYIIYQLFQVFKAGRSKIDMSTT